MQRPVKFALTAAAIGAVAAGTAAGLAGRAAADPRHGPATATPIKHLVVIFQENISFDHYFATYPNAANPPGELAFHTSSSTPRVNNLQSAGLLTNNPQLGQSAAVRTQ